MEQTDGAAAQIEAAQIEAARIIEEAKVKAAKIEAAHFEHLFEVAEIEAAVVEAELKRREEREFRTYEQLFPAEIDENLTSTIRLFLNLVHHRPWVLHEQLELHFFIDFLKKVKAEFPTAGKKKKLSRLHLLLAYVLFRFSLYSDEAEKRRQQLVAEARIYRRAPGQRELSNYVLSSGRIPNPPKKRSYPKWVYHNDDHLKKWP